MISISRAYFRSVAGRHHPRNRKVCGLSDLIILFSCEELLLKSVTLNIKFVSKIEVNTQKVQELFFNCL